MKKNERLLYIMKKGYFLLFLLCCISICLFIYSIFYSLSINTPKDNPWKIIDKFTWESNMLIAIYTILYIFKPKYNFIKNDSFFLATMTYITFTFVGYNIILNTSPSEGYASLKDAYKLFQSIWTHIICPFLFIVLGIIKICTENTLKTFSLNYWKSLCLTMIYVLIYCTYVIIIPYIYNTGNPNSTYSVYGNFTNTKDNPYLAYPIIFAICFIFFPGVFTGYFQLQKFAISKAAAKKN